MANLTEKETRVMDQLNERIKELYEKRDLNTQKLIEKYGDGVSGHFKLDAPDAEGKLWVRVTLKDNLAKFTSGEKLWGHTAFSRYELDVSRLKNEPKTLTSSES